MRTEFGPRLPSGPGISTSGLALTLVWLLLELDVDVVKSEYLFPVTMQAHFWYSSLTCRTQDAMSRGRGSPQK